MVLLDRMGVVNLFVWLALHPTITVGTVWQVFTHAFVYPLDTQGALGLLIHVLLMWWMFVPFEERFGSRWAKELVLVSALAGGVCAAITALVLPSGTYFGAGAIVLGTIVAYAYTLPSDARLSFFGFGEIQPMHMIYLMVGIFVIFDLVANQWMNVAADLGAAGGAMQFIKFKRGGGSFGGGGKKKSKPKRKRPSHMKVIKGGGDDGPRWLN